MESAIVPVQVDYKPSEPREVVMKRLLRTMLIIATAGCVLAPSTALSQTYPAKPIRIILPSIAGTTNDTLTRLLAVRLAELLAQPVIIENRPGGSGIAAMEAVARAAPDGYTLINASTSQMIAVPFLNKNVHYEPLSDYTPIGIVTAPTEFVVMSPAAPGNSFREIIDYAKRNPGKLTFGSAGVGTYFHLLGEAINLAAASEILHVPYKGTVQAQQDAISGRLDLTFGTMASTRSLVAAGKLKLIAVVGSTRSPATPDVPTINEVLPAYENLPSWFAYWGPAGLPQPIVSRLNGDMLRAMKEPKIRTYLEDNTTSILATTPEQLAEMHRSGTEVFRKMVTLVGIKAQ
jgi:tripartite-type tricarboxylate transporter receptor subunit TctC